MTQEQINEIEAAAKKTAVLFVDEFGEALNPATTDWDGVAWANDADELSFAVDDFWGEAWAVYQVALVAETERLVAERIA